MSDHTTATATVEIKLDGVGASGSLEAVRRVFVERGVRGLLSLASRMDSGAIEDAVAASSDLGVVLGAMESGSGLKIISESDPLASARLRGLHVKLEVLEKAGGVLQPGEVAGLLRMSRQAVGKRRRSGQLLALSTGKRGFEYPACQFGDGGVVPGLGEVLAAFADEVDPWMQLAFLVAPHGSLDGETPLDLMRRGEIDPVIRLAANVGEQGAL